MNNPIYSISSKLVGSVFCVVAMVFLSITHLESVPPLSWDEGWTLSVVRNWVERGQYGRLLSGDPVPPGLEASFTVTAPAAVAFQLLGVGIWQGRIVGLLFLIGAVSFLYFLAVRIYDRSVANFAVVALFMMSMFAEWHPVIMGRQLLGETPMLLFILGGYFFFYLTLSRSLWFIPLAVVFWATGLVTKGQAPPFFAVSLIVPLALVIWSRQKRTAIIIGGALASTFLVCEILVWFQNSVLWPRSPLPGIYEIVAFVPILEVRWRALQVAPFLLPTILGILYETRKSCRLGVRSMVTRDADILRVTMLVFTGSWLAWYLFASNPSYRYAFPPSFVGSVFLAKLLHDLIDHEVEVFSWKQTRNPDAIKQQHARMTSELMLASLLIIVWSFSTLRMLYQVYFVEGNESAKQVAYYLNTQTPPGSLIETYDSEIHFLLDRPYHYPPDHIHLNLIRRTFRGTYQETRIDYDPLAADPDYLVVGEFMRGLGLYDPVLRTNAFRLIQSFDDYDIFERAR
jgi:hypothetical protein